MSTHRPATVRPRPARPRWSPAARAASACRSPRRSARPARKIMLTSRKAGRPRGGRGAPAGRAASTRAGSPPTARSEEDDPRLADEALQRLGDDRHPGQQRRRHLGRAGRGPSARGLGQGDEPERARHLPAVARQVGKQQHDPAQARPHHQRRLDRRPAAATRRRCRPSPTTPPRARWSTSPARWPANGASTASTSTRSAPGFFPSKMTKGTARARWATTTGRARAAAAPRRRRGPEGRGAAVRLRRRQAHHRPDGWRSTAA